MADPGTYVNDFGLVVDPSNPAITGDALNKSIEAICEMRRFSNNQHALTVAEHSYLVAAMCRDYCRGSERWAGYEDEATFLAYIHDVPEGYFGFDCPAPVKWLDAEVHDDMEDAAFSSLLSGLGLSFSCTLAEAFELVRKCDRQAALVEMRMLLEGGHISGDAVDVPDHIYERLSGVAKTIRRVGVAPGHMLGDILHLAKDLLPPTSK